MNGTYTIMFMTERSGTAICTANWRRVGFLLVRTRHVRKRSVDGPVPFNAVVVRGPVPDVMFRYEQPSNATTRVTFVPTVEGQHVISVRSDGCLLFVGGSSPSTSVATTRVSTRCSWRSSSPTTAGCFARPTAARRGTTSRRSCKPSTIDMSARTPAAVRCAK
jgi:hypothetical protein